jgi:hypothetical protein
MAVHHKTMPRHEVPLSGKGKLEIISGWKDIANYLQKGVRTVQRYEREIGLPVRRPAGRSTGSVMATKAELDGWVAASPIRNAFQLPQTPVDNAAPLREFRQHVTELHRLREETKELRAAVRTSLELLQRNLRSVLPDLPGDQTLESSSESRSLRSLLAFPVKKERII